MKIILNSNCIVYITEGDYLLQSVGRTGSNYYAALIDVPVLPVRPALRTNTPILHERPATQKEPFEKCAWPEEHLPHRFYCHRCGSSLTPNERIAGGTCFQTLCMMARK